MYRVCAFVSGLYQKHNQARAPRTVQAELAVKVVVLPADFDVVVAAAAAVPVAPEPEPDAPELCAGTPVVATDVGTDEGVNSWPTVGRAGLPLTSQVPAVLAGQDGVERLAAWVE